MFSKIKIPQVFLVGICLAISFIGGIAAKANAAFELSREVKLIANTRIALYHSPSRETQSMGLFVFSHGMTGRVLFHEALFEAAYAAGYDVIAYDLPGHGDSEKTLGLRGGVRNFQQLQDVLHGVIQEGRAHFATEATVLAGWSLGGLITSVYLQNHPEQARAAVLYAPGVALGPLYGNFSVLGGVDPEELVQDKALAAQMRSDEGFFAYPPPCMISALLRGQWEVNAAQYQTPTLLFTAGSDSFVSNKHVQSYYAKAQKERGISVESHHYPASKHDLLNDLDGKDVIATTKAYLLGLAD